MNITEVRVKLTEAKGEKLHAYCTITIDNAFVIRDIKVIEGSKGAFVAMPSRKLTDNCPVCNAKNHLRARYCNECGARLNESRADKGLQERPKLHADVAHPINAECREKLQALVLNAYHEELEKARQVGYAGPGYEAGEGRKAREEPPRRSAEPKKESEENSFEQGIFT